MPWTALPSGRAWPSVILWTAGFRTRRPLWGNDCSRQPSALLAGAVTHLVPVRCHWTQSVQLPAGSIHLSPLQSSDPPGPLPRPENPKHSAQLLPHKDSGWPVSLGHCDLLGSRDSGWPGARNASPKGLALCNPLLCPVIVSATVCPLADLPAHCCHCGSILDALLGSPHSVGQLCLVQPDGPIYPSCTHQTHETRTSSLSSATLCA